MTYGRLIEYEAQRHEAFRREVTDPAAARRATLQRTAALEHRHATPPATHPTALLRRFAAAD